MWITILIGLRNLARRRLRTLLTCSMITIGTAMVVWSLGLNEGTLGSMIALVTKSYTGHFQVVKGDYNDKPSLFKSIDHPREVISRLRRVRGVAGVTARVETGGLLAKAEKTAGVLLVGLDPLTEPRVTTLNRAVTRGGWFGSPAAKATLAKAARTGGQGPDLPIIIGRGVAERLKAGLGDEVSFIGQAADGSIAAELFRVVGILNSGASEMDRMATFIRLADAQSLLSLGSRVHRLVGTAVDLKHLDGIRGRVRLGDGLRFLDWRQVLPGLEGSVAGKRNGLWVFSALILLVVLLGVSNTMMMSVLERTREFGVMKALGASPGRIILVIMIEAAWVSLLGVGLGLVLGVVINWLTALWGIPLPQGPVDFGGVVIKGMTAVNYFENVVLFPGLVFGFGLLAGLLPALRAARLNPALAIREV